MEKTACFARKLIFTVMRKGEGKRKRKKKRARKIVGNILCSLLMKLNRKEHHVLSPKIPQHEGKPAARK